MNKTLTIFFCLLFSSLCFGVNINRVDDNHPFLSPSKSLSQSAFPNIFYPFKQIFKKIFERKSQQIVCYTPNVTNLFINRNEITASCPSTKNACLTTENIEVVTTAVDPENDVLIYNYTVSAGKIIGQGAEVIWDLSNVLPGTYTITAGVDDGCGVCGQTRTQEVKVIECPNCN